MVGVPLISIVAIGKQLFVKQEQKVKLQTIDISSDGFWSIWVIVG